MCKRNETNETKNIENRLQPFASFNDKLLQKNIKILDTITIDYDFQCQSGRLCNHNNMLDYSKNDPVYSQLPQSS